MTTTARRRLTDILILGAVFLAFALPRWLIISQTATADETKWVARAANFSVALRSGDFAGTYQSEHPGVTVMWAGTLGLNNLFPGFASQAPGQMEPYQLDAYLDGQGYLPRHALVAGRQVMVLFNALALTLLFAYTRRLLDLQTALLAAAFGALAPFFIAHTHLMHLDGLAGSLMALSLAAFLSYLDWPKTPDLLISGAAAGLAWLTKTPAFALAPILLIITLFLAWRGRGNGDLTVRGYLLALLAWGLTGFLTFVLFWPAMWVEPLSVLWRLFQEALGYAGGGHADPVFFNGVIYEDGRIPARVFYFYPLTVLWRSTPFILLGLALGILALWQRWSPLERRGARGAVAAFLLYALLFTFFMTLGDKKFDRYLIPVYPALYLATAAGWVGLARSRLSRAGDTDNVQARNRAILALILGLLIAGQLIALMRVSPYPLSYYNPFLGGSTRAPQVMQIGWGEGLDAAGRYLDAKPDGQQLVAASWYRSVLAYHFHGPTISIKSGSTLADIQSADYAVLYIHQWQRDIPPDLLDEFATRDPEHVIEINGLEYARIYALR